MLYCKSYYYYYYYNKYSFITFNVMRLKMAYTKNYRHPEIFKCLSYIMIFPSHLLILFDISNLSQCPILHSAYLQFNLVLLFMYTKCSAKCYGSLCSVDVFLIFAMLPNSWFSQSSNTYVGRRKMSLCLWTTWSLISVKCPVQLHLMKL
jgi:hypothetical protein